MRVQLFLFRHFNLFYSLLNDRNDGFGRHSMLVKQYSFFIWKHRTYLARSVSAKQSGWLQIADWCTDAGTCVVYTVQTPVRDTAAAVTSDFEVGAPLHWHMGKHITKGKLLVSGQSGYVQAWRQWYHF